MHKRIESENLFPRKTALSNPAIVGQALVFLREWAGRCYPHRLVSGNENRFFVIIGHLHHIRQRTSAENSRALPSLIVGRNKRFCLVFSEGWMTGRCVIECPVIQEGIDSAP